MEFVMLGAETSSYKG